MKILDVLRKLGILRFGGQAAVYRNATERPAAFMMDGVFDDEKDLCHRSPKSPELPRIKRSSDRGGSSYTAPDFD